MEHSKSIFILVFVYSIIFIGSVIIFHFSPSFPHYMVGFFLFYTFLYFCALLINDFYSIRNQILPVTIGASCFIFVCLSARFIGRSGHEFKLSD